MKTYQSPIVGVGMDVTGIFPTTRLPKRIAPPEPADESLAERAALGDGETADVELVVVGGVVAPPLYPVREAGPAMRQEEGAVLVGETLPTGDPHVYTVGDNDRLARDTQPAYPDVAGALRAESENFTTNLHKSSRTRN